MAEIHNVQVRTLEERDGLWSLAWAPRGNLIATASDDKTVRLWDPLTGKVVRTLEGHKDTVTSVSFSPDGSKLASSSYDRSIKIWDVATGAKLHTLLLRGGSRNIAWSPDGQKLAVALHMSIAVYTTDWEGEEGVRPAHAEEIQGMAWSPNSRWLGTLILENNIVVWNNPADEKSMTLAVEIPMKGETPLAWSPDSQVFLTGRKLWNSTTWEQIGSLPEGECGPYGNVAAWSPNGKIIARDESARYKNTILLWDIMAMTVIGRLVGHEDTVRNLAWSPDARFLASQSPKSAKIWDLKNVVKID